MIVQWQKKLRQSFLQLYWNGFLVDNSVIPTKFLEWNPALLKSLLNFKASRQTPTMYAKRLDLFNRTFSLMWKIDKGKKAFYLFHIFMRTRQAGKWQTFIEWDSCFMVAHCLYLPLLLEPLSRAPHKSFMILSWYFIVRHATRRKNFSLVTVVINKMFSNRGE